MSNPQDDIAALREQVAALTGRIYRLEQRTGIVPEQPVAERAGTPAAPPAPVAPARPVTPPSFGSIESPRAIQPGNAARAAEESEGLESKIGKLWLNRIGIIATLVGVSYFIKYAFDNNWIGPSGRIAIGIIAGIAVVLWSERFRQKGFAAFSYSLKAIGIGTLYLSLWGAFQLYHLVPSSVAFVAMVAVTAFTM
ncbi:MAG TPA: DUF2339 domain-containing protein, partial [Terriglobales bacterium]|nr:DUF2339 domain-containing protein [Terriglobales bacterium]